MNDAIIIKIILDLNIFDECLKTLRTLIILQKIIGIRYRSGYSSWDGISNGYLMPIIFYMGAGRCCTIVYLSTYSILMQEKENANMFVRCTCA